jgi:hypothetical protein
MTIGKQLVERIVAENQPLFEASQMNIKHWFKDPSRTKEDYLLHFQGRLANEYMNMVGISEAIAKLPTSTPVEEMMLLTKQAQDEANHFRLVKEVIEHIEGKEINTQEYLDREFARKADDKGARTLKTYDVENDPVALLKKDFNLVPYIQGLNELMEQKYAVFVTTGIGKNIIFFKI